MSESLRYPTQIFFSDEDAGFIAIAPDLPGCSAFGETAEEALHELKDAIKVWIGAAKKAGNPIPSPSPRQAEELPSGRLLLRLPKTLHAQLLERANRDSTSLNTCLVMLLSQSLMEQQSSLRVADQVRISDSLKIVGLSSTSERSLTASWNEHTMGAHRFWFDFSARFADPGETSKRLMQGGSALNVRTLPANKPVLYVDDDNG
jgi:antitoxin HicB